MKNFSIKYLIIGVVILSILLIAGALTFGLFNKPKQTPNQSAITSKQSPKKPGIIDGTGGTIPNEGAKSLTAPHPNSSK